MTSTSVHQKFSGLLIVIGSLVFVCGGAFHPRINSSLGALGSTEFFQNFYMHIAHHGSWRLIHGMILVGPVLWLLGIGSLWSGRNAWPRMATTAMTLAATAWAVTFVFDGFVAPDIVRWLTPETGWHVLAVNQDAVIRLGLVSWLMLGFSMIGGSVGILVSSPSRSAKVLASVGILLGGWSFIHQLRPSPKLGRVGSCISLFEACCSDCYRVERTSSPAGLLPLLTTAF